MMGEYMTLLGTEDVQRASRRMESAAMDMRRAADTIECAFNRFLPLFDELVTRLEAAMQKQQLSQADLQRIALQEGRKGLLDP